MYKVYLPTPLVYTANCALPMVASPRAVAHDPLTADDATLRRLAAVELWEQLPCQDRNKHQDESEGEGMALSEFKADDRL